MIGFLFPYVLAFELMGPTLVYDPNSIRINSWELDYSAKVCKNRGGVDFIDAYHKNSNYFTCRDGVTFLLEMRIRDI